MRSEKEVREQLENAFIELDKIKNSKLGKGKHSRTKGYAEALEWVLKEE